MCNGMSEEKKEKAPRARVFFLLLYPDNEQHTTAISVLQSGACQCVGILHDKDSDELGEVKKAHWHFIVKYKNARTVTAVCSDFGIESRFCRICRSFEDSCRYLVHKSEPTKFQYPETELVGSLATAAKRVIEFEDESCSVLSILDYIDENPRIISTRELVRHCCENGTWSDLRRGGSLLMECLREHNWLVEEQRHEKNSVKGE